VMRRRGTPLMVTPAELEEVTTHVKRLWVRGMSCQQIADTAPGFMHDTTVAKVLRGWHTRSIHRDTYTLLMQTYYVPPTGWRTGRHMDSVGVRRRMQALVADGFGYNVLGGVMGISLQAVYQLCTREADTFASTLGYVVPVYEKLEGKDPMAYGATKLGVSRAKGTARRHNWAPSHTWDTDTIDDPDAFPEWTGACGTVTGYNLHRKERVHVKMDRDRHGRERMTVLCDACCEARLTAKSDQAERLAERRETIVSMLAAGKPAPFIAAEVGLSTRTIERVKKEMAA
jgi:hypothetical protein